MREPALNFDGIAIRSACDSFMQTTRDTSNIALPISHTLARVLSFTCVRVSLKTLIDTGRGDLLSGEMGLTGQSSLSTKQKMLIQVRFLLSH